MPYFIPLKCNYYDMVGGVAIFPGMEYFVTFKAIDAKQIRPVIPELSSPDLAWCIVNKEDVRPLQDKSGLVKVAFRNIDLDAEKVEVGIYNAPDQKFDIFTIPLSEFPNYNK